jgi:hypothetical protein
MAAPLILVVGSAEAGRTDYQPQLENADKARLAAEHIGSELARRQCRIVVYSASKEYLEGDVVRGFAGAVAKTAKAMIEVRYPYTAAASAEFKESHDRPELFLSVSDPNASWEAAFYASLRDADGIVIIGGGRSAHAIGYMALAFDVPILSLACFGGAGRAVWLAMKPDIDLPTKDHHQRMNPAGWKESAVSGLIDALLEQGEALRRRAEIADAAVRQRRATWRIGASVALLLAAIALMVWGYTLPEPRTDLLFVALLLLVGPVAGAGSSLALSVWSAADDTRSLGVTAGLGFVAGLFSSLIYLLAQATTATDAKAIKSVAIFVAMATGLLAGFAVDRVFRQAMEGRMPGLPGQTTSPSRKPGGRRARP